MNNARLLPRVTSLAKLFLVTAVLLHSGALPAADSEKQKQADSVFDPNHVLNIEIQMDPKDWEALCQQAYDFKAFMNEAYLKDPPPKPYTQFKGEVTIDGTVLRSVAVRKKGFLGSVNTVRPSLKLDFDEFYRNRSIVATPGLPSKTITPTGR